MNTFDKLCENYGVLQQTRRMLYPRQIKLSEEFLHALKKEYYRQKIEENTETPLRDRPQKFLKALQFHIRDLENNAEKELEAMRNMMDENTDTYVASINGEKKGNTEVNTSAEEKRRGEVEQENTVDGNQEVLASKQLQAQKAAKAKQKIKKASYNIGQ